MKLSWTEQAWERLLEIERFVARDDPRAAARLVDKLIDRGDALAEHPERGRRLPGIVYRLRPEAVEVLTVFEGHRLLRPDELTTDE
jgi:plasmid stabilization system protein ParE